jgi:hypothetical protein
MDKYDYIVRPGSLKGQPRSKLIQIPKKIIADLERRILEVNFAKKVKAGDIGRFNLSSKLPEGISKKRALDIINNTDKYIKQTGVNRHATVKGFREWLQRGKDKAQDRINQLNDYLFPNTPRGDRPIDRMIQEGHVRSLAEEGPNVASPPQQGRQNRDVGRWSGPADTNTFIEMGHPENWDDTLVQYLQGEEFVLTDLPQDLKTKIAHLGYDPNQVIFEHDKFLLNKVDSPSVDVVPYKPWRGTEDILSVGGKPLTPPTPTPQVTELGKPLGGIGTRLNIGGNLRRADTLAQLGISASQGDVAGMTIQGTQLAVGEALQTKAVQARLAKKAAALLAKRGAKTGLKLIPGVGLAISGAESYGYAQQGKWDQAIVSGVSGIVGELPGLGDAASAALDLWNTSQDISDLHTEAQRKQDLRDLKLEQLRTQIEHYTTKPSN